MDETYDKNFVADKESELKDSIIAYRTIFEKENEKHTVKEEYIGKFMNEILAMHPDSEVKKIDGGFLMEDYIEPLTFSVEFDKYMICKKAYVFNDNDFDEELDTKVSSTDIMSFLAKIRSRKSKRKLVSQKGN